ncbi:SsrA-binding protein SmpB [Ostreibacterium oceani]|uniref:SsrA-binding protein n=1 Tax=Ostreibacterium oceani TaxID=2654998 RepID=A0A6N7EUR8_9GAMM|nr:SsrA-binding protein SmpB [Ostreibacterium oceani]MPV85355.1 SsrA-binding protein SmpB [Ostreibacterium oceani]
MSKKKPTSPNQIAKNKKARFDYHIEETFEAGLQLLGWEVKSLREGRVQMTESYVTVKNDEVYLFGCHIIPLTSASTHVNADYLRTRKLLLNRREISKLIGLKERDGYTIIPLSLYWKRGKVKCEIGIAKGKKSYDKRADQKQKDWQRDKARMMKTHKV